MKEKQDHEERGNNNTATSPAILSPSPSSVKSPPPTQEEPEVIGAGLPLIQRLLLLKAKEERSAATIGNLPCSQPTSPTSLTHTTTTSTTRASFSGPPSKGFAAAKNLLSVSQVKPKIPFRERLKLHKEQTGSNSAVSGSASVKEQQQTVTVAKEEESTALVPSKDSESEKSEPPWSKLKKAAIVRESADCSSAPPVTASASVDSASASKAKPTLTLITQKTKIYRSIDDLSPEYGGLPFVKKLKILNERQKLEELESVMKTRSFSLDIPDSQPCIDTESLTRSQSEGSTMHQDKNLLTANLVPSSLNSSSESNETPERRNLKSILKKLTEDPKVPTLMPNKIDSTELRKLMRAPTIEGYAARHSKLSKSVTFNRDTLQSPPHSANVLTGSGSLFSFPINSPPQNGNVAALDQKQQPDEDENRRQELEKRGIQIISTKANHHQMKFIKGR